MWGNRVGEIVDILPLDHWSHVRSIDNPVDCASRGLDPAELIHRDILWKSPTWLSLDKSF